jgi:hypothetical protein
MLWKVPPPARECYECGCRLLRCTGRYWHFADKPTAPGFVAYWTNNGQRAALGLNGSVADDPNET